MSPAPRRADATSVSNDPTGAAAGADISVSVLKLALDTGRSSAEQLVQQLQPQSPRQPGALPLGQVVDLYA
jgi:hypothetical protein